MADEDEQSEILDDDRLGGDYPPDEPLGVDDYGLTAAEQHVDEPLDERVRREEPERADRSDAGAVGRLVAPDAGTGLDREKDAVASEVRGVPAADRPAGDAGTDDPTAVETATELVDDRTAEEAAMHEIPPDREP